MANYGEEDLFCAAYSSFDKALVDGVGSAEDDMEQDALFIKEVDLID